ncbi:Golgin IMH1 [Talaromyces islandicus]|uniref:Golgin IMH1 n=1 Tax=Talaromyces islandicus TaxID=28573 RepID=A0A0U1LZA2_TALIS|nr:Golgin IMH1 [Talaromyces islandicus]
MFQRLRGAIDARIAEEQARQKAAQDGTSRSNLGRRPSARTTRPRSSSTLPTRSPDPTEFEFPIVDDEGPSRSATPRQEAPSTQDPPPSEETESEKQPADSADKETAPEGEPKPAPTPELPADVRAKLRRLDKIDSKYHDLLKAYKIAHSRVLLIEPFEAALKENTPLTSISDPKALMEYLNQISLKNDMIVDELKRVTADRDNLKKKVDEAEKSAKDAWDEVTNLKKNQKESADEAKDTKPVSPDKTKPQKASESPDAEESEEFFSFDNEIPRLESEVQEKEAEITNLNSEVDNLKRDLAVARESTESMVVSLESATRELEGLRDFKEKNESQVEDLKSTNQREIDQIKSKLVEAESAVESSNTALSELKSQLQEKSEELERLQRDSTCADSSDLSEKLSQTEKEKEEKEKRLGVMQGLMDSLKNQIKEGEGVVSSLRAELAERASRVEELQKLVDFVDGGFGANPKWKSARELVAAGKTASFDDVRNSLLESDKKTTAAPPTTKAETQTENQGGNAGGSKKKKNKKKKGGKGNEEPSASKDTPGESPAAAEPAQEATQSTADAASLEKKIEDLTAQVAEKDAAIERLHSKLKGEDDLKEEIESLRDELLHIGQEHVESKDLIKSLQVEKQALEETLAKLEKEAADLRVNHASKDADSQKLHADLKTEFEDLKTKATTLEKDLSAAQQLAASRFKDLTDLRSTMQKLTPELRNLRADSAELKSTKEDLNKKTTELKKLESKHEDLRADLKSLKSSLTDRENEVKTLNQKIRQETDSRLKAEEIMSVTKSEMRQLKTKCQQAVDTSERLTEDLSKTQEELKSTRSKLQEAEEKVTQFDRDMSGLREEIELKTAQYASAQSLMNSMRDQTAELSTQMKEARQDYENLAEELGVADRLLSERSRECETMRGLLNNVQSEAEKTIHGLKTSLNSAIEERDKADDEASMMGRRRARELEELKNKVRDTEKALKTAENDREELEYSTRAWKRQRDDLELRVERSTQEAKEARQAMEELRDALDKSEKQVGEMKEEKSKLRRSIEESNNRIEKLRKANKALTEEFRAGQNNLKRPSTTESGVLSSRSSIDSPNRRAGSRERDSSATRSETPSGSGRGQLDYIYLKNVLLQFLEQKDKNYQKQLIPVLGMLLHFDRNDEQKWMSAVMSRSIRLHGFCTVITIEMSDQPVIRLATAEDVPYILQFIRELADYEKALHEVEATHESLLETLSFPGTPPKKGSTYTALITPPATAENPSPAPVGMALHFYNYSTWRSAPGIYLEDLYVQPAARGKGYGFRLLKFLAKEVVSIGGRRLEWSVLKWNEPSIKFYKSIGANAMEEWEKMMVEGEALTKLAADL